MIISQAVLDMKLGQQLRLYGKYGIPLEAHHTGKWAAICEDGETLLGENEVEMLHLAVERFGRENFALVKIGYVDMGV